MTHAPIVIADSSPINYLILMGHIGILPILFEKVIIPSMVRDELTRSKAPLPVRKWIADPPAWFEVRPAVGNGRFVSGGSRPW